MKKFLESEGSGEYFDPGMRISKEAYDEILKHVESIVLDLCTEGLEEQKKRKGKTLSGLDIIQAANR